MHYIPKYELLILFVGLGLTHCGPQSTETISGTQGIYGTDDRKDVYKLGDHPAVAMAASTAVLVERDIIKPMKTVESLVRLETQTLGEEKNLCESEPFREQPSAGFCSGFLIGADRLVTAGHCLPSRKDCDNAAFVFDYYYDSPDRDPTIIKSSDVYYCGELLAHIVDARTSSDFAIVRLDRPVKNRAPLPYRREGIVEQGERLTVIGYPGGIPGKVIVGKNTKVRESDAESPFFTANLDTYGGNSGSAVINADSGVIEGILVRGDRDFRLSPADCWVSVLCDDDGCRGEDATRATEFARIIDVYDNTTGRKTHERITEFISPGQVIPDNTLEGLVIPLTITQNRTIASLSIDIRISHPMPSDLQLTLVHPDGTEAMMFSSDDNAGTRDEQGRFTLRFGFPSGGPLSLYDFFNKESAGEWQLRVNDIAEDDTGTVEYVKFQVDVFNLPKDPSQPKPEPKTYRDISSTIAEPIAIPDNNEAGKTLTFKIDDTGELLAAALQLKIKHPYFSDLTATLIHPDGTSMLLFENSRGSSDNLEATFGWGGRPIEGFEDIYSKPITGDWQLHIKDVGLEDSGQLEFAKLELKVRL